MKHLTLLCTICLFALTALAQGKLQIASGTMITSSDDAHVVLDDTDLENDGLIDQSKGDGAFAFSGLQPGLISGSGKFQFDRLLISKTGSTTLQLNADITVLGKLQFIEGLLNMKDHNIFLQSSGLLDGESETSHLFSTGKGYVESVQEAHLGGMINPGNLGAMVNSGSQLGRTIIRRGHLSQHNTSTGRESILRYYDILPANSNNLNVTVRFQYFDKESNDIDESDLTVLRSAPTGWTELGADAKNGTSNFVEKKGITRFSRFTLSTSSPAGRAAYAVWPNPVLQDANISLTATASENIKIMVYDSHGKVVQVQQVRIGVGINQVQVDMKKLPQGNYTIQTNFGGQTKVSRVNKM